METVNLWPNEIPNSIVNPKYKEVDIFENSVLVKASKVSVPTITIYKPAKPNGTAVLIFPGGGYEHLSMKKEGFQVAEWLNSLGITAFLIKYRLPSDSIMTDKSIGPLRDAQEAMRFVRRNAEKYNLNKKKIGVIGFSAGGHLAATLSTHFKDEIYKKTDTVSAKPNFSILIYPVISMDEKIAHLGSRKALLGENPSEHLVLKFSADKNVNFSTPITFLAHATDDKSVPVENSVSYYLALKEKNIPAEMHLYEKGGHGFGLGNTSSNKTWTKQCELWLESNNFKYNY
ncbi:alpha/beta hydrolase [Halpernia frigidisoli]|nr:alpha/beta hydrolase [Halpernia frigidisoli]